MYVHHIIHLKCFQNLISAEIFLKFVTELKYFYRFDSDQKIVFLVNDLKTFFKFCVPITYEILKGFIAE